MWAEVIAQSARPTTDDIELAHALAQDGALQIGQRLSPPSPSACAEIAIGRAAKWPLDETVVRVPAMTRTSPIRCRAAARLTSCNETTRKA